MKILFITDAPLANPTGGSEQVAHQQAIGLIRQGMDVSVLTKRDTHIAPPVIQNVKGIREAAFHAPVGRAPLFFMSLARDALDLYTKLAADKDFAAVIVHQPLIWAYLRSRAKLGNVPMIYVFHSPWHEEYAEPGRAGLRHAMGIRARRAIEKHVVSRAKTVVVLSKYMQDKVHNIHGVPLEKIIVNPGGADLDRFSFVPAKKQQALKQQLGFPTGKIHLFTVRNLRPRMGLDNLLQAMSLLKESSYDFHLVLGGSGPLEKDVARKVREYGLLKNVTLTGFIPDDILPDYYGAADFFILPTARLEGFGLVTVEAMACGTPVLATPVGGTKEILSGFSPSLFFSGTSPSEMAQGIINAKETGVLKPNACEALRKQCREHIEINYSWQRHIQQIKTIVIKAVSK